MTMPQATASRTWRFEFVLLAALWGASFLFMRLGAVEFGPLPTAFLRVLIGALFLLPILILQGGLKDLWRHRRPALLVGTVNSAIPFALFSYAVLSISTGLSAILNATAPLFGALVAWFWLKDRPQPWQLLGLLIGFTGVTLLAWDEVRMKPDGSLLAVGACLLASLCYGIAGSFSKRYLGNVPAMVTASGSQIGASIGLLLPALWLWPRQAPGALAWAAMLALGVLCSGVAYILYFRLINGLGPAKAMTVTFLLPVFAVLYGALLLDEALTPWMLLCGLVIVVGTAMSTGLLRRPR